MSNILLIEPNYKNKYPPLGLMKISYFHRKILHDYVRFTKGPLPDSVGEIQWDHVYVTTLFTFEWAETIKAINYAKTLVDDLSQITVGGIAATLLPDDIYEETGIHPCCGLLNEPGKLGLPGDECIDGLIPDYSILDDIDYSYRNQCRKIEKQLNEAFGPNIRRMKQGELNNVVGRYEQKRLEIEQMMKKVDIHTRQIANGIVHIGGV